MSQIDRWEPGTVITRREVLGFQPPDVTTPAPVNGVWLEVPVIVVEDQPEHLIVYLPGGAPFTFPDGHWPTPDGLHPWRARTAWTGHGCLMMQRPQDHYAVWHFWNGPDRTFTHWYLNLQTAFRRTPTGFDSHDLELDLIVRPNQPIEVKDAEYLDDRVAEGRFSPQLVTWIRRYGDQLIQRFADEGIWWDQHWADWQPDPGWDGQNHPT